MIKRALRSDVIRTKMREIEEGVDLIRDNLPSRFSEFDVLGLVKDGIYNRAEFGIENVFDICAVLNSDLGLGVPGDDEAIVDNLVEAGVLDDGLKTILASMKGFRNIVVHRYGKINDEVAFNILKEQLGDFMVFIERIEAYLNKYQGNQR